MRIISVLLFVILPMLLLGVTRIVSQDGTGQFAAIQLAINACSNGDTVLVYPGRYIENINLNGHSITLASLYSQNPLQTYIDSTVIDGNLNTCIKSMSGETYTVNGFTLVNNEQNLNHPATNNGGAFNIWYNCHVNIQNCIIRDCIAWLGGGISAGLGSIIEFSNVSIHSNRALQWGGGIRFAGGGQLVWNSSQPSNVYNNSAPNGMDFYIANCNSEISINVSLGSNAQDSIDSFYIFSYNNTPEPVVNVVDSYFPIIDNDVYVNPSGSDSNDGITPLTPFKTIKHALQVIKSNPDNPRTVHLSAGTFAFSHNGEQLPLSFKSHIKIVGAGTGQTIINGELNNTFFAGWKMEDIFISDVSFVNGRSNNTNPIEIIDCSDIEFRSLVFSNNHGYLTSGLYLLRSNNIVLESFDAGNTEVADWNPTIYASSCSSLYINRVISHDNRITYNQDYFVGLLLNESDVVLRNTIITNNTAPDAYLLSYQNIYPENADKNLDMSNVLIYNNNITNYNWAFAPVYLQNRYQSMKINNCTFAGNQGNGYFSAIFAYADIANLISYNPQFTSEMYLRNHVWNVHTGQYVDAEVEIRNSLFRTGSIPADLPDLVTLAENIFNSNPLFLGNVTDTLLVTQPEYYYLSAGSPCINTGTADTTGMNLPAMDLAGNHRIWDGRIDMGCYEYGSTPVSIINPEYPPLPDKIILTTYPNPVYLKGSKDAYTFIEFTLPNKAKEPPLVEIFNIKGQKVKSMRLTESYNSMVNKAGLSNQVKQNGEFYSTVWNGKDDRNKSIGTGTYIIRVSADGRIVSKKLTLMK
jgi:hypothetical protein